jgi:hypothetical protein
MSTQDNDDAIAAAMDAALDDFEDDDEEESNERPAAVSPTTSNTHGRSTGTAAVPPAAVYGPPPPPPGNDQEMDGLMQQMMQLMQANDSNGAPDDEMALMGHFLQHMQSSLQGELAGMQEATSPRASTKKAKASKKSKPSATAAVSPRHVPAAKPKPETVEDEDGFDDEGPVVDDKASAQALDETIANLVESLAKNSAAVDEENDKDDEPSSPQEAAFLEQLLQQGGSGNPDALLEGMMGELMSKALMYEPLKQVAAEFPQWLETHKDSLSAEEFQQ